MKRKVPWRFIVRRWWVCKRKTGHSLRAFHSSTEDWMECYCGIKCEPQRSTGPEGTAE